MSNTNASQPNNIKDIIAYSKEYGFIFPSSEIYEGLQAIYDYGPYGIALKKNIQRYWWESMVKIHENIVGLDSAILMHPKIWKASGHIDGFHDIMVDNKDSKKRYRIDTLIESYAEELVAYGKTEHANKILSEMNKFLKKHDLSALKNLLEEEKIKCKISNTANWTDIRTFNLMLETSLGPIKESSEALYLRPETAQGIFVNYLNVQKSLRMKIPFGVAQIGKAFRNEIVARQFIFRMREFEQMEMQFFVRPTTENEWFEYWKKLRLKWHHSLGIPEYDLTLHNHEQLAHYASAAVDIEYKFPFGIKEVEGIHSRTDFDLKNHQDLSGKKLQYFDPKINESYIPYVIETSVGLDRVILMILSNSIKIQISGNKERKFLQLIPQIAPIKAAILPIVKKDGLGERAYNIYNDLKYDFEAIYDDRQSIGKRYAKQDLIGTPFCLTVDHQTLEDEQITIRFRDTTNQKRISLEQATNIISEQVSFKKLLKQY